MGNFLQKLKIIVRDSVLRKRILFIFFVLVVFRALASVPIPGVDVSRLGEILSQNQFLGLLNIFSGGGLTNLSIVMLGVAPYITASIIMQLGTIISTRLKALYHEEGEAGRKRFSQYSRLLSVPLAITQGFGLILLLTRQGVIAPFSPFDWVVNLTVVVAGSLLLMWLGELISEFGIGNGVSILIFAGIVAALPATMAQLAFAFEISQIPLYIGFIAAAVAVVAGVVFITESERPIPVTYAKRVRGNKMYGGVSTYIPLRVNQAGVIPIIFALSILLLPQMIAGFVAQAGNETVRSIAEAVVSFLNNGWFYSTFYFALVFLFTYFYTAVTFDPNAIATNLQKGGAFIPGVRPGTQTSEHIAHILTRITFVGALFLGLIAVLPLVMQALTGITALAIGGTALLIVVSVVIDLIKKIDAQLSLREY
ncbi:MAG: preprotein translocase subunit SecY [Patescibacteria group bacterium]|mgnify:CR=1 FL=1